jgi:hypothetical protein
MLEILNRLFLPFFLLVSLPVLIHLFTRHKKKLLKFSSVRFLIQLEEKRIKRLKLKQIILLILRTLIVFLLIAAFARPTIRGFAGTKKYGTSTDNGFIRH